MPRNWLVTACLRLLKSPAWDRRPCRLIFDQRWKRPILRGQPEA